MASILDYNFGSKLNKFVEKIPKFNLKGCFDSPKSSYVSQSSNEAFDMLAEMQELSQRLTQNAIAVPTKQAYKVAKAVSSQHPNDIGMKNLVVNLSTFPEEVLGYNTIEELRQSCLKRFPDSYTQEFFKRDMVRLSSQNDMDVEFLTKVAATITSQSDFERKVKQLDFEGSDILNVDKRQFLLAHINESLAIEDTFPCDTIVEEEHLGYIKNSHKKYMADVYKAEIAENLQRVIEKNAKFEIPHIIDFNFSKRDFGFYDVGTPEYQAINSLEGSDSQEYLDEMFDRNISVLYDSVKDAYIVSSAYDTEVAANTYEIPEEIDFRTCTASINLKVGSDRVEYHLLSNLWSDESTKETYCTEMKSAGVVVAYNEDDTYTIEKECDTIEATDEHTAALDIPDEIDFSYYDGETLYFGADTPEYKAFTQLSPYEVLEYNEEMRATGVVVIYDDADDVFTVINDYSVIEGKKHAEHEAYSQNGVKIADKIEKIWVVEKPKAESTIEDILFETTIGGLENQFKGGLSKNDIAATFTTEAEAKELAEKLLKEKTATAKKADNLEFGKVPKKEFLKMKAVDSLGLTWDNEGYWIDKDEMTISDEDLSLIVDNLSTDKGMGMDFYTLKNSFDEISEHKKEDGYKKTKELEDLGQQRLPGIANKKADSYNRNVVKILPENQGYDISVFINGEKVKSNWKKDYQSAYQAARIFADFYKDENGQSLDIKPYHSIESKKADLIPTPVNMPEQEIYTRLTNETKDALSKIQSHAAELKTLRDEHLQVHDELDAAKNKLAEEKQRISAELSGYLDISGNSFTKICVALTVAETLEAQEEVILNAITTSIDKVIEANEKAIPEDATNILDILKHMGNVADNIVVEAKNEITKMSEGVNYVRHALRKKQATSEIPSTISETLKTKIKEFVPFVGESKWKEQGFMPNRYYWFIPDAAGTGWTRGGHTNNYVDFLEGLSYQDKVEVYDRVYNTFIHPFGHVEKQATIDEGKFWPWIKTSIFGAKKFYGFADRNVDSFVNDYGNLIKILLNY